MSNSENFKTAVDNQLKCSYLVDGKVIKGQSLSYLRTELRDQGWIIGRDFEDSLNLMGFKILEGRTMRMTKTGLKAYGRCTVVIK